MERKVCMTMSLNRRTIAAVAAWALIWCGGIVSAREISWNPEKTQVFAVGLLRWHDGEAFDSFPGKNRRDARLVEFFRKAGVPASQIVYLPDRKAKMAAIETALRGLLARSEGMQTLVVYYCGHGYESEDDASKILFAPYDAGIGDVEGWAVADLVRQIRKEYKGRRVILLADCCHSGALVAAARSLADRFEVACLASSTASASSTGNWTFTEAVLAGFGGDPCVDLNRDGRITFSELQQFTKSEMRFAEEQTAPGLATPGLENAVLATTVPATHSKIGAHAVVKSEGDLYKGRILDVKNDEFLIWYYGYEDDDCEWVTEDRISWKR